MPDAKTKKKKNDAGIKGGLPCDFENRKGTVFAACEI